MVRVRRRGTAIGMLVLCAWLGLAACTPGETTSTPTPTGFTSEDEAFAAAEATYRAYVDALNAVDLSDPATFEDVYVWTTGTANATERETLSQMHAEGWSISGTTEINRFEGVTYAPDSDIPVLALVCTDISGVDVVDPAGVSQVSPDRPDGYQLRLEFVAAPSAPHGLVITRSIAEEPTVCA